MANLYSKTEIKIIAVSGIIGGFMAAAVGGFDKQLLALFILMVVDYATGMYAAWHEHTIFSKRGYQGIMKKLSILVAVSFGVLVDMVLKTDFCRYTVIAGFGVMEAISIIENADRGGYGHVIPPVIRKHLKELKG
ncbi:MAG: phage holin family protein [Acholeplasmataceae bacterium]|nr:phage holin family protein [Acholeplasmataceae bacterium]